MTEKFEYTRMDQLPDIDDLSLPEYFPMAQSTIPMYGTLISAKTNSNDIDSRLDQIKTHVNEFLDLVIQENLYKDIEPLEQVMNKHMESITDLVKLKVESERWNNVLAQSKGNVNGQNSSDYDLSLATLDHFRNSSNLEIGSLIKKINQEITPSTDIVQYINNMPLYQLAKNACHIIKYPEQPLVDETEEDEVMVSGGKVDLKDPISFQMFSDPVKSITCGHVYERSTIEESLTSGDNICPISGCQLSLKKLNLINDDIMRLRVKVFKARMNEASSNILERL